MRLAGLALPAAAVMLPLSGAALAQGTGGLTVTPTLALTQSFTDNTDLSSTDRRSEAITTLSAGVRLSSRSGHVQGSLDYALNAQAYARDEWRSGFTNALAAAFTADVVQGTAAIDTSASISQQNISAFGVRAVNPQFSDSSRAEVRTIGISPVVRGRLSDSVTAEARSNWVRTSATASSAGDSTTLVHSVRLSGRLGSSFGWSADVSDLTSEFESASRKTGNQRVNLGTTYTPSPDLMLSFRAGRETDTVRSLESRSTDNVGAGVTWTPSPRTTASAQFDRRYFGNAHSVQFTHRIARGVFSYTDSRDVNNGAVSDRTLQFVRRYDELFRLFAAADPRLTPADIDVLVRFLLDRESLFIGRAVSLQRRQDISFALSGVRTTLVFAGFRSDSQRLDQISATSDDVALANGLRQHGYSLIASYAASPTTSVSLAYSSSTNGGSGAGASNLHNELKNFTASLSGRLARRVSYSLSVRHSTFDSTLNPYTENGGQITLSFTF